ncbi:non-homologous end-joining factor 1 [Megalopta genalis]|uniref:non-homologous end-joining factor 1 n=1 Tax=Megalopta genalis TaxID=115081 RepID=UPI003FD6A77B
MTEEVTANQFTQERKWNEVNIGDNVYMISVTEKNNRIEVFLTNFIEIWMEILTDEVILKRCKDLNPLLNVDALNYKDIVASILNNLHTYIDEASVEQIKLRIQIDRGSMKFILNLSKGTQQKLWEIITKPLCISFMELNRRHKIILDLIKKKDKEIAEYRAEGVELTRKNIQTEVFKEEQLKMIIPVPSMNTYINVFQESENFYNKLNLQKESEAVTKSASDTNGNKIEQTGQTSLNPINKHNNGSKQDILRRVLTATSTKSRGTSQKDVHNTKMRTINVMHKKPIKKLSKGLKNFIS